MNQLAQIKPLTAQAADEARQPLFVLFAAYPEPWSDRKAEHAQDLMNAKVSAYLLGLQGLPRWAIEEAVAAFVQGRVERPDRRKGTLPTVEELSTEARKHVVSEATRQRADRQRLSERAEKVELSEEHRQRMGFKMRVLSAGLALRQVERVKAANESGLDAMMALAQEWQVQIPECLWGPNARNP